MFLVEMRDENRRRTKDSRVHIWADGETLCGLKGGHMATVANTAVARGALCRNCTRSETYRKALLHAAAQAIAERVQQEREGRVEVLS